MKFFDKYFYHLSPGILEELDTLQNEGAVYAQFGMDEGRDLRFCRIKFTPPEIFAYVEGCMAYDEFQKYYQELGDPSLALEKISNRTIINRVLNYNIELLEDSDGHFCFAAFIGDHLEGLVCGWEEDRYEFLAETYDDDRKYLLTEILESFPHAVRFLANRMGNRESYSISNEQDVRDLLFAIIKCSFPDAKIEDPTQIHAGSSKRIDIVIPKISTIIEVKYVRDKQHSKKIADELKIDIESYHSHPSCSKLFAFIWDSERLILDRSNFISNLRGLRTKDNHTFSVEVLIKP